MINFQKFTLDNGLRVLVHEDPNVPVAVLNLLYDVGSRDELEDKTGFAHLFEHLMFGGSANIPEFDKPLQKAGGSSNAFTSPDVTNYYVTLPAQNIETGFWLESDRMQQLAFNPKSLEVQKKVVIEEFKQRYLNQPYGDVWLKLRPMAYQVHPYKWPTIGKEVSHIENATLEDVESFFYQYYRPNNAILIVAGGVKTEQVKQLAKKWFGPISAGNSKSRNLPAEPIQTEGRSLLVEANVPANMLYKAWHMCGKADDDYYATDLLNDILGRGKSSVLYQKLVKQNELFDQLSAYITGSMDSGLFVISGRVCKGISVHEAHSALNHVLDEALNTPMTEESLTKVKNQTEFSLHASETELLNRAINLAYAELMGDPNLVNEESERIRLVDINSIKRVGHQILKEENANTLFYCKK